MNGPGFIIDPFSPPGNFDGMNFNANILIIASSHSVNSVYNRMLTPILPLIMADFGLNYAQTGLIASVYALSSSLFQLPISFLGDFTGKTRLILGLSLLFNALPAWFYGYSTTYAALLTFVFLSGLGCSAYHPAAVSMITRESPRNRGLAMGLFKAGGDFGSILTPVAMGWLAVYLASWQAAAQYFVLPGIVCALVIWLRFQDAPSERKSMAKEAKSTFAELFGDKFMILMTLLSSCRVMGLRGIMTFLPLLLAEGLGLGTIEVGWVLTGYFLVGTVFAVIWGKYTDGKNETRIIILMMATSALALAFLSRTESMVISLGLLALLGACLNPSQSLMLTLTTGVVREKNRTSAIGLMYTANEAASVASPFLGGLIAQAVGLRESFLFYSLLCLIATSIAWLIHAEQKRRARASAAT